MTQNRQLFPFEDIYSPMLSPVEAPLPSSLSALLSGPLPAHTVTAQPTEEPPCDHSVPAAPVPAPHEEEMDCCDESAEDALRRGPPLSDTPGGDCTRLCVRHQRMANGGTNIVLQKSLENLSPHEQQSVNTIWSLFSSSPSRRRLLILQGLLTIACPSQLSFLQDSLTLEMRLDPLLVLPREVSLKLFAYLDAISLGRAAQVSKFWRDLADDDLLWRTMCEQHIEKKCEKCGWGLPLLGEKKRKAGRTATVSRSRAPVERTRDTSASRSEEIDQELRPFKRSKTESPAPSRANTPPLDATHSHPPARPRPLSIPEIPTTRPWKSVYCERLVIERNWRRGTYVSTILSGHTDSITCLQVAEDLPHPTFPILMTGSWDRSVRIWNLETGKEVGVLRGHTRGVRALQFDATKLVTGSMDSTLKIWNWRTGECMRTLRGHSDAVICLTYDKQLLISGSVDSTIRVWDFGTGEGYSLTGHTEWVNSVALWDSKVGCGTGVDTPETPTSLGGSIGASSNPEQAKASSKGKFLFSASDDMTIRVWDLYERTCVRVLKGHVAQVQSLRVIEDHFSIPTSPIEIPTPLPSSSTLTTTTRATRRRNADDDDNDDDTPLDRFFDPTTVPSRLPPSLSPAPTSHLVPTLCSLPHPPAPETSALPLMSFEGDKKPLIISASLDNTIKMWDVEGGLCKRTMFGHIEGVWDVDVDKLRIVSGSHDRTLKVWDKESGRCLHTLVGHTSAVTSVILRDQYVISGGDDGNVRIWNFASSKVM